MFPTIFVIIFAMSSWLEVTKGQHRQLLTDDCLRCLCAASSDCSINARCRIIEPDKYLCGPFRLSDHYWQLGGNMTPPHVWTGNPLSFELCANDLMCSLRTVQQVMGRYFDQCNFPARVMRNNVRRCFLVAFVHYRMLFLNTNPDYDDGSGDDVQNSNWIQVEEEENDNVDDDHLEYQRVVQQTMSCQVDMDTIEQQVGNLMETSHSTRADDRYWQRFAQCSENFIS